MTDASTEIETEYIALKWGTLKSWKLYSEKCMELLRRYVAGGMSMSAMANRDTPEQKQLLCELIDQCNAKEIFLDWDGKYVSKEEAKKYILGY